MALTRPDSEILQLLKERRIASLATRNADDSVHMTAVWFLYENDCYYVATSSTARKARNAAARPQVSIMLDVRREAKEWGVTAAGTAQLITGEPVRQIVHRIHERYMSAAAIADPQVGPVFAALDDVVLELRPTSWLKWKTADLDNAMFGGKLCGTPGYLLPLAE